MKTFFDRDYGKAAIRSFGMVISLLAVVYILVSLLGVDKCPVQRINNVRGFLYHKNGTIEKNITSDRWITSKGDTLVIDIQVPSSPNFRYSSLEFGFYNSTVELQLDGRVIYSYGDDLVKRHRQIGHVMSSVELPQTAWGKTLYLTVKDQERTSSLRNSDFSLVPSEKVRVYPAVGRGMQLVIFLAIMLLGLFIGIAGVFFASGGTERTMMTSIGISITLLCIWYFGYCGFWYSVSTNTRFNSMAEYYALDLVPVPLFIFICSLLKKGIRKKVTCIIGVLSSVYSLVSVVLTHLRVIVLSDALPGIWIILIIMFGLIVWLSISGSGQKGSFESIMLEGMLIAMLFAVAEIVSIRVRSSFALSRFMLDLALFDYAAYGLTVLIIFMIIAVVNRFYISIRERTEQQELERLAYMDMLTGIHNRLYIVDQAGNLTDDSWYGVGFFDVDGLKKANDTYGHEVGDALITGTASLISESFGGMRGYFGRWGGDEFLAVFLSLEDMKKFRKLFAEKLVEKTQSNTLPVVFSVSAGYVVHEKGDKKSFDEMINEADQQMYENKRRRRAERK